MGEALSLLKYCKEYGVICTLAIILFRLFHFLGDKSMIYWMIVKFKHRTILNYLYHHYYIKLQNKGQQQVEKNPYANCIWTAWLQGEENAPEVVKLTIASMRKSVTPKATQITRFRRKPA